jgi:DNA-binding transcriptional MerR regulator
MKASDDSVGVKAACRILEVTETTVRRLANRGVLTTSRDDAGRRRFQLADLKKLARKRAR